MKLPLASTTLAFALFAASSSVYAGHYESRRVIVIQPQHYVHASPRYYYQPARSYDAYRYGHHAPAYGHCAQPNIVYYDDSPRRYHRFGTSGIKVTVGGVVSYR
ncbi:MAG: hypothetical protein ACREUA_05905 [Burkholderiales bacterium]